MAFIICAIGGKQHFYLFPRINYKIQVNVMISCVEQIAIHPVHFSVDHLIA